MQKALYPLLGPHPDKIFVEISKFQIPNCLLKIANSER